MQIKFGCDPEIFLARKDGQIISAAGLFPGTKKEPFKIDKGAVQVDGCALEFNIDPVETEDQFFTNIHAVMSQMTEMISKVDKDLNIHITPVAHFDKEVWEKIEPDAKILGCDPDYNVQGTVNPNPGDQLLNTPLRTGSGHIHIGWSEGEDPSDAAHFEDCRYIAQRMNQHIHPYFGSNQKEKNLEQQRFRYYGGNGAFRPKPYGVELRSPSNFWIRSEQSIKTTFRNYQKAFQSIAGV